MGTYKQAFFQRSTFISSRFMHLNTLSFNFKVCRLFLSFSHLRQTAYAKAGLQRGFAALCCSGHRLMAHHLISIIGQIAMMMKKCIIVHSMTHTGGQLAGQPACQLVGQPASQHDCCMYPVKVRKTYKVFCHSGGFEGWVIIFSHCFD